MLIRGKGKGEKLNLSKIPATYRKLDAFKVLSDYSFKLVEMGSLKRNFLNLIFSHI